MLSKELEILKEKLKQNVVIIKKFDEVDNLLYCSNIDEYIIFDSIILKNYFINNTNRTIINCNSSYEHFIDEINTYFDRFSVFNNVNFCNDIRILNIIDKTNNLKIE
jgi:uncharacterized membrane protein